VFRVLGFVLRVSGSRIRVLGFVLRASGSRFRVSGFGFRITSFGFRVPGLEFRVSGFGFKVETETSGFDFISGFGFRFHLLDDQEGDGRERADRDEEEDLRGSQKVKEGHIRFKRVAEGFRGSHKV